ncbi:MAG TPA: flagellar basal body-associated FliL family protein [Candidatus Sulfopaludibacter sp.]|nr:flagellar basal body-associated FliL family protein [Candidatus Sulfopaludibacter sp.]
MPEDRTPQPPPPTDDAPPPASASSGGGFKAWLPPILIVALMPLLAFGMTQFVLLPQIRQGLGITAPLKLAAESKSKKENSKAKPITVTMSKILVNVAGTMGARYLLVSLAAAGTDVDFKDKMQANDAQLRDIAGSTLSTKTLADLEKPGERNLIRNELITGFNNILGDSTVQDIYFTEFAIQ